MKYWRLYQSAEKEVGFVPQITEPIFNGHYNDPNQLWNNPFKELTEKVEIPKARLHKKAIFTDFMTPVFASGDNIISVKTKEILDNYVCIGLQFLKTQVFDKKEMPIDAFIMHSYRITESFLDLNETFFHEKKRFEQCPTEEIQFKSLEELHQKRALLVAENKKLEDTQLHKSLRISKLAFNKDTSFGIASVFDVLYGGIGLYVSETLKQELLDAKCTGIIFRELDERYP